MTSRQSAGLRELHAAMIDMVVLMNRPERDEVTFKEAGISLDRGLYALVSGIERFGPIGVVDLAVGAGRDYTTVSRQVAKLVELGFVKRRPSRRDARVNEAVLTRKGRQLTDDLAAARERIVAPVLAKWSARDFNDLVRLIRRFVDDLESLDRADRTEDHA